MGSIAEKLQYTKNSINDIQDAINEKGVELEDDVELGLYGDKIREIRTVNENDGVQDYYTLEKFVAFNANDLLVKSVEDVSDRYDF